MRKKLFRDEELRSKFHKLIRKLYDSVIVPDFKEVGRKYLCSNDIAKRFAPTVQRGKEEDDAYSQVTAFEKKEEVSPSTNKYI